MTMIADLRRWNDSVTAIEGGMYDRAVELLDAITQQSSKTLYNTACCLRAQNKLDAAVQYFSDAVEKDEHMAIGYFQRGNTYVRLNRPTDALRDFEKCVEKFRGRKVIDYNQLGLKYKFYICEPLHNAGCVHGNKSSALDLLHQAQSVQAEPRHSVIQDSIRAIQTGQKPSILTIPETVVFRPPKSKMRNLSKKDFLGKATVVSAVDEEEGAGRLQSGQLTVDGTKQKCTSAPNSPLAKHKPIRPQVPRIAMGERDIPAVLPKSVSINQNLSMASLLPETEKIHQSKSDSSIDQIKASGTVQTSIQRPPQYRMPPQSQRSDSYSERTVPLPPRRTSLPQEGNVFGSNRQPSASKAPVTGTIPPPPNKPIPPRPPPKLPPKLRNCTDNAISSSQIVGSSQMKSWKSSDGLKTEKLPNHSSKPGNPALPPKPLKPPKPGSHASTELPIPEFQALRAALKPVGARVLRNKPD